MLKLSISIAVLLLGVSAAYYFLFALPKIQAQRLAEQTAAGLWEREQQCSSRAEHFFTESKLSEGDSREGAWYENHFSHHLNKCVILMKHNTFETDRVLYYQVLMDVNDGKTIAEYDKEVKHGQADYAVKPFVCRMLEKYCESDDEYDAFVKRYMED
jgi:hypothetical protein